MHLRKTSSLATVPAALLAASVLLPTGTFAHEHRDIDAGKYSLVVGWDIEPAYLGQPNAATIRISSADMDSSMTIPVTGAEQTLSLTIRQGDMSVQLPLHPVQGKPGSYAADITPERAGDAQWTLAGSIGGDPVNEVFDTADGKFDAIKPGLDAMPATSAPQLGLTGQLGAALDMLDNAGLHGLDGSIDSGVIPEDAMSRVQQAEMAVGMGPWPAPFQDSAVLLSDRLRQLHEAIEAGDVSAAMAPAHEAHELSHAFATQARDWLAAQNASPDAAATTMQSATDMDHDSMSDMAMH